MGLVGTDCGDGCDVAAGVARAQPTIKTNIIGESRVICFMLSVLLSKTTIIPNYIIKSTLLTFLCYWVYTDN